MEPSTDPGVTTPPVEPAASAAPVPPTGSEPVKNTDGQTVPFARFQEVNDSKKAAEDRITALEAELEAAKQKPATTDEDIEPDTLELISKSVKKLGYVSKAELDAREARIQVQQDINDLTNGYKDSGIPFDGRKVIEYAKANGMPIGSKKSLDAVYKEMNYDAIVEAQRKAAVAAFQETAKSGGEKPGSKGARAPQEQKPTSIKDRIKAAREKAGFSLA